MSKTIACRQMQQKSLQIREQRKWLKNILADIQDNVADQASILRSKTKTFNNRNHNKQHEQHEQQKTIGDIKAEENIIRAKLRQLKMLEKSTRKKTIHDDVGQVKSNSQLRILTKKYRQFKQNLEEKTRNIKKQDQQDKIEAVKLREQQMKTLCQERRKKIQQTLKQMQARRKNRQQMIKIQRKKLKQLKKQKLFQKMKQNFNKKVNQLNQQKLQSYRRIRKQYSVNISALSQHQKTYEELKIEKQERRTVRLAQSRMLPQIKHYKSRFFDRVIEQEKQRKRRYFDSQMMGKKIKDRHKQYQDRVHQQFLPPLKQHEENSENSCKKVPLDRQEMKKIGNQMYRQGQRFTVTLQRHQQLQKSRLQLLVPQIPKPYPNYLPQFTSKLHKNQPQHLSTSPTMPHLQAQTHTQSLPHSPIAKTIVKKSYFTELQKIKDIIMDQKMKRLDKLQQIRLIMEKLQHNYIPNQNIKQEQLIQRLNAKLEILRLLEEKGMRGLR